MSNLVAACDICNLGKGAEMLDDEIYLEAERERQAEQELLAQREALRQKYIAVVERAKAICASADRTVNGFGLIAEERHPLARYQNRKEARDRLPSDAEVKAQRKLQRMIEELAPELKFDARISALSEAINNLLVERKHLQGAIKATEDNLEISLIDGAIRSIDSLLSPLEAIRLHLRAEHRKYLDQVERDRKRREAIEECERERQMRLAESRARAAVKRRQTMEAKKLARQQDQGAALQNLNVETKSIDSLDPPSAEVVEPRLDPTQSVTSDTRGTLGVLFQRLRGRHQNQ